tara:strand:- start:3540 stop:4388 length:849 start_codon:yes stop_codon:yes gene_type:complete
MSDLTRRLFAKKESKQIIAYVLLFTAMAWLGPLLLGGTPEKPALGFFLWGIAPMLSALLVRWWGKDWKDAGWSPKWRGNQRWYLLSLLIFPALIFGVLGLGWVTGMLTLAQPTSAWTQLFIGMAVTFLFFATFEEIGWRGFLAPKMATLHDGLLGHVIVGIIWASWHFPFISLLLTHTSESIWTLLPRFIIGNIALAILMGELRIRTGSVWPAVLMHWIGNTVANSLLAGQTPIVTLTKGSEFISSFGAEGIIPILVFGVSGYILYRKRKKVTALKTSAAPA